MRKNNILYIDYLNYISLFIGLLIRPFFTKVYYHNAIKHFHSAKARTLLNHLGMYWMSYLNVPASVYTKSFDLNFNLDEKVLQNRLSKSTMYQNLIIYFKMDSIAQTKLNAALRNEVLKRCILEGTSFITLIQHVYPDSNVIIYYLPISASNYLLIDEMKDARIIPLSFLSIINDVVTALKHLFLFILHAIKGHADRFIIFSSFIYKPRAIEDRAKNKCPTNVYDLSKYEIGFFPHANLHYLRFFKKTYLYEAEPESLFYKKNILTLFHGETDSVSKRYLELFKIPHADICSLGTRKTLFRLAITFLWKTQKRRLGVECLSVRGLLCNTVLSIFAFKLLLALGGLDSMKSMKLSYVHYDSQFPQEYVLACYLRSIKTISAQERPILHIFFGNLCYDHYLINGPGFIPELEKRHYACQNYHVIGMPRSRYIKEKPKHLKRYEKYIELKKKYKLVVCYGFSPSDDFHIGINGECGNSLKSVLDFLDTIKRLSDCFQDLYFVLRFKDTAFLQQPTFIFKELLEKIDRSQNIEITHDFKKYNSYTMAYLADLIIGKQTSIMEEALSVGKKVIFYDNEKYLQSCDYIINKLNIVESDFYGLKKRITEIVYQDHYMNPEQLSLLKTYFFSDENKDGFSLIKFNIAKIYEECRLPPIH